MTDWTHPDRLYLHHTPSMGEARNIEDLRTSAWMMGKRIRELTPECPERTLAMRALHQALQHAVFAIVADDGAEEAPDGS